MNVKYHAYINPILIVNQLKIIIYADKRFYDQN